MCLCSCYSCFLTKVVCVEFTALEDPPKLPQLIRSIYRHFIQNTTLLGVQETSRAQLTHAIIDSKILNANVFDKAENEVQAHMRDHLYPNFLKSDIYLSAANEEYGNHSSSSTTAGQSSGALKSSSSAKDCSVATDEETPPEFQQKASSGSSYHEPKNSYQKDSLLSNVETFPASYSQTSAAVSNVQSLLPNHLQTVLEEDSEPSMVQQSSGSTHGAKIKLTREALLATQSHRAAASAAPWKVRKGDAPIRVVKARTTDRDNGAAPFPYHANYASYNPVSRVDSEIQSLSSDGQSRKNSHHHHHHGHKQLMPHGMQYHYHDKKYGIEAAKSRQADNKDNLPIVRNPMPMCPPNREAEV